MKKLYILLAISLGIKAPTIYATSYTQRLLDVNALVNQMKDFDKQISQMKTNLGSLKASIKAMNTKVCKGKNGESKCLGSVLNATSILIQPLIEFTLGEYTPPTKAQRKKGQKGTLVPGIITQLSQLSTSKPAMAAQKAIVTATAYLNNQLTSIGIVAALLNPKLATTSKQQKIVAKADPIELETDIEFDDPFDDD